MYPLSFNSTIMSNSTLQPLLPSTSTNDINTTTSTNISVIFLMIDHKFGHTSTPNEFPSWISTIAYCFRQKSQIYFIPTSLTTPLTLSNDDKNYLVTVFIYYPTSIAYPNWFAQKLTKFYFTLAHIIALEVYKYGKAKTCYDFSHELSAITFHTDTGTYDSRLQIHYLQKLCTFHSITVDEHQSIKSINCHLLPRYDRLYPLSLSS